MRMFDRLDRIANRQADRMFSVGFTVQPMRASANGRPSIDPERGELVGRGIFDQEEAASVVEVGRRDRSGHDLMTPVDGHAFQLSVDSRRHPEIHNARQGDLVVLDDARRFSVAGRKDDGFGRLVLKLSRA